MYNQPWLKYFIVKKELSEFKLAGDHKAFWIPGDYDTNEYNYTTCKLSEIDNRPVVAGAPEIAVRVAPDPYSVQTPLMMKSDDGVYINIHEAALINYPAMQLHLEKNDFEARMSVALSLTIMVRQGEVQGACIRPLSPLASGVSHD